MSFVYMRIKNHLIPVQCFETDAWENSDMWLAGIFIEFWIDSRLFWWALLIIRLLTDDSLTWRGENVRNYKKLPT